MEKHHASCSAFVLLCCTTINVFVGATSIVPFFSDPSCQDRSFTGQTDQQAFSGTCQPVSQEANSVDPGSLDSCCAGSHEGYYFWRQSKTLTSCDSHGLYRTLLLQQSDTCTKWNLYNLEHRFLERGLSMRPIC